MLSRRISALHLHHLQRQASARRHSHLLTQPVTGSRQWHSLSGFASSESDLNAWTALKSRAAYCDSHIDSYGARNKAEDNNNNKSVPVVDWGQWEESIQHTKLLDSIKNYYKDQMSELERLGRDDGASKGESPQMGWDLYTQSVAKCESSLSRSEKLLADGARALWLSCNNPPAWKVEPNEWLESDEYWQGYVEKHHHFDVSKDYTDINQKNNFEDEGVVELSKKDWVHTMDHCHDPIFGTTMYQLIDQPHSWAYYYIHRRAFFLHMMYFLVRTGSPPRLMPEIPPPQWLTHMSEKKYSLFSVSHRATLANEEMKYAVEDKEIGMCIEKSVEGEVFAYNMIVGRLMSNYMLFCHPYIPVQSEAAMLRVSSHHPNGKYFALPNVSALFYLPVHSTTATGTPLLPSPREASESLMDYVRVTGRRFDTVYSSLMEAYGDTIEQRGKNWLQTDNETMGECFLRRLSADDPMRDVYERYVEEMKEVWGEKSELTEDEAIERMKEIEPMFKEECRLEGYLHECFNPSGTTQKLSELIEAGQLKEMLADHSIVCEGEAEEVGDAQALQETLLRSAQEVEELREYIEKKI